MSYLVLARKYRPSNFDDVVGQAHITDILKNAIAADRLGQAYLFCGPRGIGKTSCARILAKALNCEKGVTSQPCGVCPQCQSITQGNSFDVLEIDGASNRGIDEIRTIRENVKFAPSYGRYKVYIVDEVHMLTTEAFNALLKTLEEPPEHVKFIFATTDPNKLPATIVSRCQRFDFKRISFKELCSSLERIAKTEKLKLEQAAVYAIAKAAQGSFRDALSVLDQISALTDQAIKGEDVYHMLGLVEMDLMFSLVDALGGGDCGRALEIFDSLVDKGKDIKQFTRDLVEHFRHLMIIKLAGTSVAKIKEMGKLVDYPGDIKDLLLKQSRAFDLKEILAAMDIFIQAQDIARITETERTPLEIAFAKFTLFLNRPAVTAPEKSLVASRTAAAKSDVKNVSVKDEKDKEEYFPGDMIKNQKGQLNPAGDDNRFADEEEIEELGAASPGLAAALSEPGELTLESVIAVWDALTHAVSRERMSLATYLQEGFPHHLSVNKLTIGFSSENRFFKESLEAQANVAIVEKVLSEKLRRPVVVRYEIVDGREPEITEQSNPVVQDVLKTFGGKITSRWHNE